MAKTQATIEFGHVGAPPLIVTFNATVEDVALGVKRPSETRRTDDSTKPPVNIYDPGAFEYGDGEQYVFVPLNWVRSVHLKAVN